jgi:hypothetical protein
VQTIHVETELPTDADRVWAAICHPASFNYVCRGLIGIPALVGRTEPMRAGEIGTAWLWLFHLVPFSRHTIEVIDVDDDARHVRTHEHGGFLRAWNHTLHVEPISPARCRYSDTVDIDAGALTPVVAKAAVGINRYRQRRWHKLVDKHLLPTGPASADRPGG